MGRDRRSTADTSTKKRKTTAGTSSQATGGRPITLVEGAEKKWDEFQSFNLIHERKFLPSDDRAICGNAKAQLDALKWGKLATIDAPIAPRLVREFYANLSVTDPDLGEVRVRGVIVNISTSAINAFLGITPPHADSYTPMVLNPPLPEMLTTLCKPGEVYDSKPSRYTHRESPKHLSIKKVNRFAKAWIYWINASILPSTHEHHITFERLALLYCIATGRGINLGRILHDHIIRTANRGKTGSLGHGSLITAMCESAGAKFFANEQLIALTGPIDPAKFLKFPNWKGGDPEPNGRGFINIRQAEPAEVEPDEPEAEEEDDEDDDYVPQSQANYDELVNLMTGEFQSLRGEMQAERVAGEAFRTEMRSRHGAYEAFQAEVRHNINELGRGQASIMAFQEDYGHRHVVEAEFHRSVYETWTARQDPPSQPDMPFYPTYPPELTAPFPPPYHHDPYQAPPVQYPPPQYQPPPQQYHQPPPHYHQPPPSYYHTPPYQPGQPSYYQTPPRYRYSQTPPPGFNDPFHAEPSRRDGDD